MLASTEQAGQPAPAFGTRLEAARPLRVMPIFGTRPEAIKMAPLINLLKSQPDFQVQVCVTAQQREILDQVLEVFGIAPDFDLDIMQAGQTLTQITTRALIGLEQVLADARPDIVLAQGDTTTVLAAAMAASYQKIAFGHVEAGLRSGDKFDPFPEELNRRLTGQITDLHFAPTQRARENLLREGVEPQSVFLSGNTVIDALFQKSDGLTRREAPGHRMLLVTTHRRENWGEPLQQIALALRDIVERFPDTRLVHCMHPNPIVRQTLQQVLGEHPRVELREPLAYIEFVELMRSAHLVLTDSGGVQEEAPALGLPVLVLRRTTERPEGVQAGTARLVGTDREEIVRQASRLLSSAEAYGEMSRAANPYGDGKSSERILAALRFWCGHGERPADFQYAGPGGL